MRETLSYYFFGSGFFNSPLLYCVCYTIRPKNTNSKIDNAVGFVFQGYLGKLLWSAYAIFKQRRTIKIIKLCIFSRLSRGSHSAETRMVVTMWLKGFPEEFFYRCRHLERVSPLLRRAGKWLSERVWRFYPFIPRGTKRRDPTAQKNLKIIWKNLYCQGTVEA